MSRAVHEIHCPGCGRRIRASNKDELRPRVLRHVRNCNALKFGQGELCMAEPPPPELPQESTS